MRSYSYLLLFAVLSTAGCGPSAGQKAPEAQQGVVDLRNWNFAKDGPVRLAGEWQFHWKQFSEEVKAQTSPVFVRPGPWNRLVHNGHEIGAVGFGTYQLRVLLPGRESKLALNTGYHNTAARLSISNQASHSVGRPGKSAQSTTPVTRTDIIDLETTDEAVITVEVANYFHRRGGMLQPPTIGLSRDLNAAARREIVGPGMFGAVYLLFGLYHLLLHVFRKNPALLWFGLLCVLMAGRSLLFADQFAHLWFPEIDYRVAKPLEYLGLYLLMPCVPLLLSAYFPKEVPRFFVRAVSAAGVALCLTLMLPPIVYSRLHLGAQVLSVLMLCGSIAVVVLAVLRKRPAASLVLLGFSAICVGAGLNIASSLLSAPRIPFLATGLLVFVCVQAIVIARRFSSAFAQVETLSQELELRNTDLLRLDRLKDEFLANTSHELRTPLHGIIGITESMLLGAAGELPSGARNNLELVASSGRRLTGMVNDILDYSKARHGDINLVIRAVDPRKALDLAIKMTEPLLADKDVTMRVRPGPLPYVAADPDRLEQVLINLLGNAAKFTVHGSIEVYGTQKDNALELSIQDSGIGIPNDRQQQIFDSFTQADASIERQFGGTGLGLSICRHLIELHGGQIGVESAPGHGSRFFFTLPLYNDPAQADQQTNAIVGPKQASMPTARADSVLQPGSAAPEGTDRSLLTIAATANPEEPAPSTLIVDDDPTNRQVLANLLSLMGHKVTSASSGAQALSLLQADTPIDLVLLDVMMPGLSGYDVCRALREMFPTTILPVILLTAMNRPTDIAQGLAAGANDYLTKPFEPEELIARVQNTLELKKAIESRVALGVLQSEIEMARTIQRSLLPANPPRTEGLDIQVRYRAMARVGGDFYDFHQADNQLGVLLADVSGHGVPAALIVSVVKMAFLYQRELRASPAKLLERMNDTLRGNIGSEFVTAAYFWIDVPKGLLLVGNAGHPPLLIQKVGSAQARLIRPFGRLLGILSDGDYESESLSIEAGDRLVAFTDGVFEAKDGRRQPIGIERLVDFLQSNRSRPPAELADALMAMVTEWSGGQDLIADDVALIVIDVHTVK